MFGGGCSYLRRCRPMWASASGCRSMSFAAGCSRSPFQLITSRMTVKSCLLGLNRKMHRLAAAPHTRQARTACVVSERLPCPAAMYSFLRYKVRCWQVVEPQSVVCNLAIVGASSLSPGEGPRPPVALRRECGKCVCGGGA